MSAPTYSLFDTQSKRIEEVLSRSIELFLAQSDPVWRDVVNSTSIGPVNALGRGMEVVKFYQNAVAGVIESGGPRSDWTTYGDPNDTTYGEDMFLHGNVETFPDATEDPSGIPIKLRLPMRSILTNMKVSLGEMQLEALPATIGAITAPRMMAFARNIARRLCSAWYTSQATNYRLCQIGASTGTNAYTIDGTAKTIKFYPTNYAIGRFAKGDRVDFYRDLSSTPTRFNDTAVTAGGVVSGDAAGQTYSTRIKAIVSVVNRIQGYVVVQFDPATSSGKFTSTGSLTTGQLGSDTYVVWANSSKAGAAFTAIPGLNSWLKFGGSTNAEKRLLGAEALGTEGDGIINVETHPEFMSFYKSVSGLLTEHRLNLYLDRVAQAFEIEGHYLDTLVTTREVIRATAAQKEARQYLDRTGRLSSLAMEGEDGQGMVHHHDGRTYKLMTSTWMSSGELVGYRRENNWVRYTPPRTPGSQTMPGVESNLPFELVLPALTGLPSVKTPIRNSSGRLSDLSEMPGHLRMTLLPEKQVRGMKLVGITEERVWGDPSS